LIRATFRELALFPSSGGYQYILFSIACIQKVPGSIPTVAANIKNEITNSMELSSSLEANSHSASQETPRQPRSQVSAIGAYSKPDESNPHRPTLFP
jgi:hypothetical protein